MISSNPISLKTLQVAQGCQQRSQPHGPGRNNASPIVNTPCIRGKPEEKRRLETRAHPTGDRSSCVLSVGFISTSVLSFSLYGTTSQPIGTGVVEKPAAGEPSSIEQTAARERGHHLLCSPTTPARGLCLPFQYYSKQREGGGAPAGFCPSCGEYAGSSFREGVPCPLCRHVAGAPVTGPGRAALSTRMQRLGLAARCFYM